MGHDDAVEMRIASDVALCVEVGIPRRERVGHRAGERPRRDREIAADDVAGVHRRIAYGQLIKGGRRAEDVGKRLVQRARFAVRESVQARGLCCDRVRQLVRHDVERRREGLDLEAGKIIARRALA